MNSSVITALLAYDLPAPTRMSMLSGHGVVKVETATGAYVASRQFNEFEPDLYATVEETLNGQGIRQPRIMRSIGGRLSVDGWWLRKWIPGSDVSGADVDQLREVFAHLSRYDAAVGAVAVPPLLKQLDTPFTRVLDARWLRVELPGLCRRLAPEHHDLVLRGLARIADLPELPRQVIHGDLGPDNILVVDGGGFCVIDFTPHYQPRLAALAGALYWFCVHPFGGIDRRRADIAVTAYNEVAELSRTESQALPAAIVLEALRRVATPLALAGDETPVTIAPSRVAALRSLVGPRPRC